MLLRSLFTMFLGFFARLPQGIVKALFAFALNWQVLLFVPLLVVTWVVVSQHIDSNGNPTGRLKQFKEALVGVNGSGGYYGVIREVAEDCGGQILDPRLFFECVEQQ